MIAGSKSLLTVLLVPLILMLMFARAARVSAATNLVANGSFEEHTQGSNQPDGWTVAGNGAIKQTLSLDAGPDGGRCAQLECTVFSGDGPDFHVMLCQVGKVSVRQGQWYRLTFRAKAQAIKAGAVDVALSDTSQWRNAGLEQVFTPLPEWKEFQFVFRAGLTLMAEHSRLQIWFKGTGTLWLDDVLLTETAGGQQWFPQIATAEVKNWVPNSSFECGTANWGSFTHGLKGWGGNLYRLEGEWDSGSAAHGRHSLKITLNPRTQPVFYFDYYEPVCQPVRRVLAANQGWFRVTPGETLTLSVYLRADRNDVPAELAAIGAPDHVQQKQVAAGKQWRRESFMFKPAQDFIFIAAGLDLENSELTDATLWLDAVQLERGNLATPYEPRHPVEAFLETSAPGNICTNPSKGLELTVRAFNNTGGEQTLDGKLEWADFFERKASRNERLALAAHGQAHLSLGGMFAHRLGYFRATWSSLGETQSLRCAVIEAWPGTLVDSPLGFNHAYPWDFLLERAQAAGVVWWRDWSAKWQTVEPVKGKSQFAVPDTQIERVRKLGGQVEVLLPFPSALWSSTAGARSNEVAKAAGDNEYLRSRLPVAFAPQDLADFGAYAAAVARHYAASKPNPVTHIQILNEPVYTDYALPRQFGYGLHDYLRFLETASRALRQAEPGVRVVGGISAGLDSGFTRDFVTQGGLRFVDVFDLHMYDPARPAEAFEDSFSALEQLINSNGGPKPVWITEWGCYADDDPPSLPVSVGDATMNRCRWPDERAAAEHIVKFTAVSFAHGVRKIFFHAGTCGTINGPDAGGVLFEYGGTPRKMYPAVATLSRLLGVPERCVARINNGQLLAYLFTTRGHTTAIAWAKDGSTVDLTPSSTAGVYNIVGNKLEGKTLSLGSSPVFLTGDSKTLLETLGR